MLVIGPRDGFSEKLAENLKADFIELNRRIFPDNEVCPRILLEKDIAGKHVVLVNRMQRPVDPNRYLVEFLLTIKNLRTLGIEKIDVVIPYFVYARQDKIFRKGEPLSAEYVLKLLKDAGASRFFSVSIHFNQEEGGFDAPLPAFNISGIASVANYLKLLNLDNPVIIGPDKKSGLFAREISGILGCESSYLEKKRDLDTGKAETETKLDATGRDVVIVDDIASSGGTLVNAIENLSNPNKIICAVVHPVLTGECLEKVSAKSDFIACNTIESPISKISVTGRIANFIGRSHD
jgi:ribose-phosphate pyrophosphokinase